MKNHYSNILLYIFLPILMLYSFPLVLSSNIYWVSSGVEQNMGSDGSESNPWVGIEKAIAEIRRTRGQGSPETFSIKNGAVYGCRRQCKQDILNSPKLNSNQQCTLMFKDGIYFLSKTLVLDARDSFLELRAANPNGTVVISGGTVLSTWTESKNGVRYTEFSGNCGQAFVGKRRLIPARTPDLPNNGVDDNINMGSAPYHHMDPTSSTWRPNEGFRFNRTLLHELRNADGDNVEDMSKWKDLAQTKVLIPHSWTAKYATLKENGTSVAGSSFEVLLSKPLAEAIGKFGKGEGPVELVGGKKRPRSRFVLYNNIALLNQAGESVCIENENGPSKFYYIPPSNIPVIVSQLQSIVIVRNIRNIPNLTDPRPQHITFNGLSFQHSSNGGVDGYAYWMQAVRVESADAINFENCEFSHTGSNGIFIADSENYRIQNNVFHDIGFNGIYIKYTPGKKGKNVMIHKNTFDGMGMSNLYSPVCILVAGEKSIEVSNNDCRNNPWTGIHVKGPMENGPNFNGYAFEIRNNRLDKLGQGILNDFGAIKVTAGPPSGSKVEHDGCVLAPGVNQRFFTDYACTADFLRKHQFSYAHIYKNLIMEAKPYHNGGNCMYSDVTTSKTHFDGNICYGPWKHGSAFYHHCGIENESTNNIAHRRAPDEQLNSGDWYNNFRGGCEKKRLLTDGVIQEYTNEKNIYLMEDYTGLEIMRFFDTFKNTTYKNNIYWSLNATGKNEKLFRHIDRPMIKLDWTEWKNLKNGNNDLDSLWADPLFEDASNMNYKLKDGSPAAALGFQDIALDWIPALDTQTQKHKEKISFNAENVKRYLQTNNITLL